VQYYTLIRLLYQGHRGHQAFWIPTARAWIKIS
jgi:hypothetical protein